MAPAQAMKVFRRSWGSFVRSFGLGEANREISARVGEKDLLLQLCCCKCTPSPSDPLLRILLEPLLFPGLGILVCGVSLFTKGENDHDEMGVPVRSEGVPTEHVCFFPVLGVFCCK